MSVCCSLSLSGAKHRAVHRSGSVRVSCTRGCIAARLGTHLRKYYAITRQCAPNPCHASPASREMHRKCTARVLAPRTCTVLRRTTRVPGCIKTRRVPGSPHARAIRHKPPRHGLPARFSHNWHGLCVKPCHRINVDPARVQQHRARCITGLDNGVPRIQSSTGFAGRRFYFRNRFRAPARRQRFKPSTLRKPRS